jgi:hypothetical protein
VDYVSDGFLIDFMRDRVGQLGESGECQMGRSESGLHDIWSSEGGSPRLCRLRTASVDPPATSIDYVLNIRAIWVPANLVASTVAELDDTLPRFTDD